MSETVQLLLYVYGAGYIAALLLDVITLLPGLFSYNSTRSNNLRLILVKRDYLGQAENYRQPRPATFLNALKDFGVRVLLALFISLLSWIYVVLIVFASVKAFLSWLLAPSSAKAYRWKLKNVPFYRAEDVLKHSQEHGFMTLSERLWTKALEELANRSEMLARTYAERVFGSDQERVDKYVNEARHLTKEVHDSVVIHPRFWAIPQEKDDAEMALHFARHYRGFV